MEYRKDIDCLKGLAIIAVVLFHMGLLKSGYLGVDAFFVINGFLVVPALFKRIVKGEFSYFKFMEKKLLRLIPLVVVASVVCLAVGFVGMLPDNYENLAESVVASNLMSENILSSITTNYWDVSTTYKPLMHLWYVGILFEFYLLLPIMMLVFSNVCKWCNLNAEKAMLNFLAVLFAVSLLLYLLPWDSESNKFYFIQYRLFELLIGGILGVTICELKANMVTCRFFCWGGQCIGIQYVTNLLLLIIIYSGLFLFRPDTIGTQVVPIGAGSEFKVSDGLITTKPTLLILTVILTGLFIINGNTRSKFFNCGILAFIGKRSYSIFIWHQVLLAFYRYYVSNEITVWFVIMFLILVMGISELSYRFIEQKVKISHKSFAAWVIFAILVTIPAVWIYMHAGVVRDVPEQNITFNNVHRGMHGEYCDRVYKYDTDFPEENGKINVLVEGVSYGRDFANCLLESQYADSINLSYVYVWDEKYKTRITKADVIFVFSSKTNVPYYVWRHKKPETEVYGIGTKVFGESNGIIYSHRGNTDYLDSTVALDPNYKELNDKWSEEWGNNYIDFIAPAIQTNGKMRVFTPEGKFISQDCRHLTKEGAEWYASQIRLADFLYNVK